MSTVPSLASQSAAARRGGSIASQPLAIALVVVAMITAVRSTGTVDSDVAWQLWIAGRIHAGAKLYTDIIETNPPLWFWMALPVERVASLFHVRIEAVLVVSIGILVALSLGATDQLIRHIPTPRRMLLLAYGALTLDAMPWVHVGQREQIALIGALPYAALIAARRESKTVPLWLAALIGTGSALAFALKHYFLIVPAILELWLVAGLAARWRPVRPEIIAMATVGITYAAAIALLEPNFLSVIVPMIRLAYDAFGAPSLRFLFGPFALAGLVTIAVLGSHVRFLAKAPLAAALLITALGFVAVYFVQSKGWTYHALPMLGCASLAVAALMAESRSSLSVLRLVGPALLALPFYLSAKEDLQPTLPSPDVLNAVSGLKSGDTVAFLTTETAIPWSVTLQGGYRYTSRYNGFWMMRAIMNNYLLARPDPRLSSLGRRVVGETVADFTCTPPRRIIVWRPQPGEDGLDILPFFLLDPRFGSLLSHYRVRSRTSLETYELVSPLPRPSFPCRKGI